MLIKDLIAKEKFGNVKIASVMNVNTIKTMVEQMNHPQKLIPSLFYSQWLKGKNSVMDKLSVSLIRDYPIELRCGYKSRQFYVTSLLGCDIIDYIHSKLNYEINFKKNKLLPYSDQTYIMLTEYIMSLTLAKYKIESLYPEHIIFICINTLFTFFKIYEGDEFLVKLLFHFEVENRIINTDISVFENKAEELGIKQQVQLVQKREVTPTIEDIMLFVTPEDSQTEIKNKIMKWYLCKERKARQIMTQLGLTNSKYTRKDFQKEE